MRKMKQNYRAIKLKLPSLYLMKIKLAEKLNYELMSVRDARIMIIAHIYADQKTITLLHNQMINPTCIIYGIKFFIPAH